MEQNEYREALVTMCERCVNHEMCQGTGCTPKNNLNELVNKASPQTPIVETLEAESFGKVMKPVKFIVCPNCTKRVDDGCDDYCRHCGQRLDWDGFNEQDWN